MKPEANIRLRKAMKTAGITFNDIAAELKVNPKTAQRWVYEGRTPRPVRAEKLAAYLQTERSWLWPEGQRCEIYSPASTMPAALLHQVTKGADRELWAMTGSAWLLSRIAFRPGARLLTPSAADLPGGVEVRCHQGFETSVVRADEAMFVIPSSFGWDVPSCPALFLTRTTNVGFFERYEQGFEVMWRESVGDPVTVQSYSSPHQ